MAGSIGRRVTAPDPILGSMLLCRSTLKDWDSDSILSSGGSSVSCHGKRGSSDGTMCSLPLWQTRMHQNPEIVCTLSATNARYPDGVFDAFLILLG